MREGERRSERRKEGDISNCMQPNRTIQHSLYLHPHPLWLCHRQQLGLLWVRDHVTRHRHCTTTCTMDHRSPVFPLQSIVVSDIRQTKEGEGGTYGSGSFLGQVDTYVHRTTHNARNTAFTVLPHSQRWLYTSR